MSVTARKAEPDPGKRNLAVLIGLGLAVLFMVLAIVAWATGIFGGRNAGTQALAARPFPELSHCSPIPGLYIVGCDAGGLWGESYSLPIPGSANGFSVTSGWLAADDIAATIKAPALV